MLLSQLDPYGGKKMYLNSQGILYAKSIPGGLQMYIWKVNQKTLGDNTRRAGHKGSFGIWWCYSSYFCVVIIQSDHFIISCTLIICTLLYIYYILNAYFEKMQPKRKNYLFKKWQIDSWLLNSNCKSQKSLKWYLQCAERNYWHYLELFTQWKSLSQMKTKDIFRRGGKHCSESGWAYLLG